MKRGIYWLYNDVYFFFFIPITEKHKLIKVKSIKWKLYMTINT